ncbi:MAG: sodium-dependent transporter [Chlamydiia bacterium]|nr:sodium-dependent transporter [Chlamydiia bacterium]
MSTERESWKSRLGFVFAAVGSAVGLANIWKFPYTVGNSGGAAFIILYLAALLLIGLPVFVSEVLIGRAAKSNPRGAMRRLSGSKMWEGMGMMMVITGFIVSAFYSAVAGWIFGYLVEAASGRLSAISSAQEAQDLYSSLMTNPYWGVGFHLLFIGVCMGLLYTGVQHGIERGNKIMMPALIVVLLLLVFKGLTLPGAGEGLRFLLSPDWSQVTGAVVLSALGQSFFTLSVGQGTMITYGSYLDDDANIVSSCVPIALIDTLISIMSTVAVFTIVFSAGLEPTSGPGLLFHTLPLVFGQISGGYIVALLFFLLVVLAAVSSEISAMEPLIAYLMNEKGWTRHHAVLLCAGAAFVLGIPCALSSSLLSQYQIYGMSFLDLMAFVATEILVPVGGLASVVFVGWRWGIKDALKNLRQGSEGLFKRAPWILTYFRYGMCYVAPALVILVFLNGLGLFG